MEYFLRQIHHGITDPLNIDLKCSQVVVGRSTNPELKRYIQLSRQHARFLKVDGKWFVEDMKSLNGVFVNGSKIGASAVLLQVGDHVGLGVPSAGTEDNGFVCCLSARPVQRQIPVIDLCDDPPVIKAEPSDDYPDYSNQPSSILTSPDSDLPKTSDVHKKDTHASGIHQNGFSRNNDGDCSESSSHMPVSNVLNHQDSSYVNASPSSRRFSAVSSESSAVRKTVNSLTLNSSMVGDEANVSSVSTINLPTNRAKNHFTERSLSNSFQIRDKTFVEVGDSRCVKQNHVSNEGGESRLSTNSSVSSDYLNSPDNRNLHRTPDIEKRSNDDTENRSDDVSSFSKNDAVKPCHVHLMRCDSDNFKLPAGVKSPVLDKIISAKKRSYVEISVSQRNKRRLISSDSSSLDDEEKQNSSKIPAKMKKVEEFAPSHINQPSSSGASNISHTLTDQSKFITNSNSSRLNYVDPSVSNLAKVEVTSPPKPSSLVTAMDHTNSIEQNITLNEKLAKTAVKKAFEKDGDTFASTSSAQIKSITNSDSIKSNQINRNVSNLTILDKVEVMTPPKPSESTMVAAMDRTNNVEQSITLNENLAKTAAKKESEKVEIFKNLGYSQPDEDGVIIISDDDEDYMDFNSSQVIKQEPLDDDAELDYCMFDQMSDNEVDRESILSESIENIKLFVQSTVPIRDENLSNVLQEPETVGIARLDSEDESELSANTSKPAKIIPSKITESSLPAINRKTIISESEGSSDSDSSISEKNFVITPSWDKNKKQEKNREVIEKHVEEVKSKGPKSVGRALLIEPQKLNRRPTRLCGRGEWFDEKTSENAAAAAAPESKSVKAREPNRVTRSNAKTSSKKKQESTRQSILNKLQSPNRHVANAVVSHSPKKKLPRPFTKPEKPPVQTQPQKDPSTAKKKNPTISRRPNEYASRSAFLVSDMQPVTAKRKPENQRNIAGKKEFANNTRDSKNIHPIRSKANNNGRPVPNAAQPTLLNRNLSVGVSISNQSKKTVPPPKAPPLPSTSRSSSETNIVPYGNSSVRDPRVNSSLRDPRLLRKLDASNNTATMNQNYGANNPKSNVTNMRNVNYNNFTERIAHHSNVSHPTGNSAFPPATTSNYHSQGGIGHNHRHGRDPFYQNRTEVCFNYMIRRIVEFSVKWLEEQKKLDKPPPDVSAGAINLPLFFNSVEDYISSFFPMLMLEVWDNMYQESKIIFETKKSAQKFYFTVLSTESKGGMTIYDCQSLVNKNSFQPSEGNILLMDVRDSKGMAEYFGYVFSHRVEDVKSDSVLLEWEKMGAFWLEDAKLWRFSVYLKSRPAVSPLFRKLMKGFGICSIRNRLRYADALKKLTTSPLSKLIIKPNENDFFVKYPNVSPGRDYSDSQMMAIEGIGSEILKLEQKPKIILLQGPPGTGKTHTIIGLLEKLTLNPKFRILVVAPSNAAVDEIGSRLLFLIRGNSRNQDQLKFVRVGLVDQMNRVLKPYSLDEKASKLLEAYNEKNRKTEREKIEKLQKQIAELKKQKQNYAVERQIKVYQEDLKKCEENIASKYINYGLLRSYKNQVLRESNIVLSTLGSCGQIHSYSAYQRAHESMFSCCILDEASQCTEVEALAPLMFGITKLIMVGDHQQLPATVNSKMAIACGYERSMFERFHLYFSKHCNSSPIFMLNTQFRMHSAICDFPSKYFYDSQLLSDPHNDIRDENFPLHPYIVYDIVESQESDSLNSKTNCTEAHAIIDICSIIIDMDSHSSIGIITPYQAQRALYAKAMGHNSRYRQIEVNTVDGFQGREKDIVIVSCVRANGGTAGIGFLSCPKRLNVAITRACKCLIICIHSNTLVQSEDWRNLIEDARNRQRCVSVNSYKDMQRIFKETMVRQDRSRRRH